MSSGEEPATIDRKSKNGPYSPRIVGHGDFSSEVNVRVTQLIERREA